ncbi:MAG: hypothetical protein M5R36_18730 [Deltaproteobacteria bacterium]|nr:hypothetical protein [Deltaproteobacteria bacterium]
MERLIDFIKRRGYQVFFGLSLAALAALAVWWSVFLMAAIDDRHQNALGKLGYEAEILAERIGRSPAAPAVGPWADNAALEIRPNDEREGFAAEPNWPAFAVAPTAEAVNDIYRRYRRQKDDADGRRVDALRPDPRRHRDALPPGARGSALSPRARPVA